MKKFNPLFAAKIIQVIETEGVAAPALPFELGSVFQISLNKYLIRDLVSANKHLKNLGILLNSGFSWGGGS